MTRIFSSVRWSIVLVAVAGPVPAGIGQVLSIPVPWYVNEFQPNVREGGRVDGFAVHPTNDAVVFATSETGGLFRSTNRGATWRHVDSLPCYGTNSVAFVPSDPNILLVTTRDDFKATGGGGIWRSADGGNSWAQVALAVPAGRRMEGYEIAIAPDTVVVVVGTPFGCQVSADNGQTWTARDPFAGGAVFSVAALGGNRFLAGGWAGAARSSDGGVTWPAASTNLGPITDLHAFGRSPLSDQVAFVANRNTELFRTLDGGDTWTKFALAPAGGGGCGGICFVKAVARPSPLPLRGGLDLYFSNRCGVARLRCPRNPLTGAIDYGGSWESLSADHGDTRDLAFTGAHVPMLLGTDGGMHRTADGGTSWTFVGGGTGGFNALQITEAFGQTILDVNRHDLYYGTQDNNLYASGDGGVTWGNAQFFEGFFLDSVRRVTRAADSKITYVACSGCSNNISDPLFVNATGWADTPGQVSGNPKSLGLKMHVQGVEPDATFTRGLAFTSDLGATWSQYASFPEARLDLPKLSIPASRWSLYRKVLYQAVRVGDDPATGLSIDRLVRISKSPFVLGPATVHYPAMTGFGGLGINPTMFAWYEVFGVNPDNPNHLIAPDVINERVMQSRDGGETWTEITQLTALVTDGGRFRFRNGIFPVVTAVSFCPDNPSLVMVGTTEGGIFVSQDGGTTWSKVAGSDRIPLVSSLHWRTANDVIVSSYGRGLWRLQNRLVIRIPDLERWCRRPCMIWRFPRPDPPPFDRGILVFDGTVLGARFENNVVREIFVSPGSSLVYAANRDVADKDAQTTLREVKVTESAKWEGFSGVETPVAPQQGWVIKGLMFDTQNRPLGAIFGDQPADMHFDPPPALVDDRPNRSPIADKPYARVIAPRHDGGPAASPGDRVRVTGERFPVGADLVLTIGGQAVGEKVTVTPNGTFDVVIPAPVERGFHRIEIRRNTARGEVLDAVMVLVKHEDRPGDKRMGDHGNPPLGVSNAVAAECVTPARRMGRFTSRDCEPRPLLGRIFRGSRGLDR